MASGFVASVRLLDALNPDLAWSGLACREHLMLFFLEIRTYSVFVAFRTKIYRGLFHDAYVSYSIPLFFWVD